MKIIKNVALTAALMASAGIASAADKIVVLDMQRALMATNAMQEQLKALNSSAEYSALKAKVEGLEADLEAIQKNYAKNKDVWSPEQIQEQRIKAEGKEKERRLAVQSLQQQKQTAMKKVLQELGPKAETALKQITVAEGIDLVLTRQAAVWTSESTDITAKLTDRINKAK